MVRADLKISPQRTSWSSIATTCMEADSLDAFDGVWLFDHLSPVGSGGDGDAANEGCFEGWTALAALAALTSRLRLGLLVSAAHYRNVGVLAQMASTIDHISHGRIEIGLGAGNNEAESRRFGIPFGSPRARTELLDEYLQALRPLLGGDTVTFNGTQVQLSEAHCSPPPVQERVPILVGGKGERRTLRAAATRADGWNYSVGTPEEFSAKLAVLNDHAGRAGIDPASLRRSVQVRVAPHTLAESTALAKRYIEAGATDIVAYINPLSDQFEAAVALAQSIRAPGAVTPGPRR